RRLVEIRNGSVQRQCRLADAEALAFWIETDGGFGCKLGRREARGLQLERQRHGEATGMSGGDQFFGIGTLFVFEAGLERVGRLLEYAGIGGEVAIAGASRAAPNRFCLADHWSLLC